MTEPDTDDALTALDDVLTESAEIVEIRGSVILKGVPNHRGLESRLSDIEGVDRQRDHFSATDDSVAEIAEAFKDSGVGTALIDRRNEGA